MTDDVAATPEVPSIDGAGEPAGSHAGAATAGDATAGDAADQSAGSPAGERPGPVPALAVALAQPPAHVTKVKIETPGATVEIEAQAGLDEVARVALQLFHQAGGWPRENTHSAGFASSERRDTPPAQPSGMYAAPGSYPVQLP